MVDVKKMKLKIEHYPNWFNTISIKLELVKTNSNNQFEYYAGALHFHDEKSSTDFDYNRCLRIRLTKAEGYFRITILSSIHDWYFGLNSNENFSKSSFNDCIDLLSEKLSIPRVHLSKAIIMELSWKAKIPFREEHHNFMNCILEHKTLKNKTTIEKTKIGKTNIKFWSNDKKLIISKTNNKFIIDDVIKFDFYVEFEIQARNISNISYLKDKGGFIKGVSENWEDMIEVWKNEVNNLIIVDSFSPEISDYLNESNMTKMSGYLVYVGIKHYGLENFRQLMTDKMVSKKLYEYRNNYMKIYEKFENLDTPNYRSYFETNVELIAEKLKK